MNKFKLINPKEIKDNPFGLLDNDWMLIAAGTKNSYNMMTAAWGGFGILWNKPVAYIFIRPQRYTFQFTEKNEYFSLTFFPEEFRDALNFCGSRSGRVCNKTAETKLTPLFTTNGTVYFDEARLVLECRKIYQDDIKEDHFIDKKFLANYPLKDYHRMYIGEIVNTWVKQ